MSTAPVVRLHLYFARDNAKAVILRQGPSKVFHMTLWDRDTDTFEDGQWLKHKVYTERCDLSPDGQHFLFFALDGKWGSDAEGSYTAICRPPWFTALALYPQGDTWGGGGEFIGNGEYVIYSGPSNSDIIGRAANLERVFKTEPTDKNATGIVRADGSRAPLMLKTRKRILKGDTWRPPLDQYDTMGGRLYRRNGEELTLIRDFTEMEFEPRRAPYDWRGDDSDTERYLPPWHPLDKETP